MPPCAYETQTQVQIASAKWTKEKFPLSGLRPYTRIAILLEYKEFIMGVPNLSKSERIDVRASAQVKQLLQNAARACHKNVSEFLLDAGIVAANQALADRNRFELDEAQWQAFQQALERPVQHKPRLKKLLAEPGMLD